MRALLVALSFVLAAPASPVAAQSRAEASAVGVVAVARGLEAQYRAALIRDRQIAEVRQVQLIEQAETRMRDARHALAAATANRAAAQAELERARASYVQLVNSIPLREAAARIEVEAFRSEIEGGLAQATPELLAAYEQFADGDRADAWRTLDTLLTARARARITAARTVAAAELRQAASLREIMRAHGEATAADVIELLDQAVDLNPRDFFAHAARARLMYQRLGDLPGAEQAIRQALAAAASQRQRVIALNDLGDIRLARRYMTDAIAAYEQSLAIVRQAAESNPDDVLVLDDLAVGLTKVGETLMLVREFAAALESYEEALRLRRRLAAVDPNDRIYQRRVGISAQYVGDAQLALRDLRAARASFAESLALSQQLLAADPADAEAQRDLAIGYARIGGLQMEEGDLVGAQESYRQGVEAATRLAAADATNLNDQRLLSTNLNALGIAYETRRDFPRALASYRAALEIRRRLAQTFADSVGAQRDLVVTLTYVGTAQRRLNDEAGARESYEEALAVIRPLAMANPNDTPVQGALIMVLRTLTEITGDRAYVREALERALALQAQGRLLRGEAAIIDDLRRRAEQ